MPAQLERELKFRLPAGVALPPPIAAGRARRLDNIYYDTKDQRLRSAGLALRLRRDGRAWQQTLKWERNGHAGLSARSEWEVRVPVGKLNVGAFPLEEVKRATGIDLRAMASGLRPLFRTRFMRRSARVSLGGRGAAELCLDRGEILAGRLRAPIREVELELKSGTPAALLAYAERLALPLAYESKAERGYRLAARAPRTPLKWRPPTIHAGAAPEEAFTALFGVALAQAGANAPGVLEEDDPEYLHQMRVGLRRLRSLLRAFAPILERTGELRRELRALMGELSAARDWDVITGRLGPVAPNRQAAARGRAHRAVASTRFSTLLLKALRWIESRPFRSGTGSLAELGARSLQRLHRKAQKRADPKDEEARHALRIRIKRLRYAVEYFACAFPVARVQPALRALEALQDLLGELNDIAVARRRLGEAGVAAPAALQRAERRLIAALPSCWSAYAKLRRYWRDPARRPH